MNLHDVAKSFHGHKHSPGKERHSLGSLSKRLLLKKGILRKALRSGELHFEAEFECGPGGESTFEFSSSRLDATREAVVDQCIEEIRARLAPLGANDQEIVLASLHGLRAHEKDINEFAAKRNDPDDEENHSPLGRVAGGFGGGVLGASLGGRFAGTPGLIGGAVAGTVVGGEVGEHKTSRDIAGTAAVGVGGLLAHKQIVKAGGYEAVAKAAGVKIEHVMDYAGIQSARLPGIAENLGKSVGNLGKAAGAGGKDLLAALRRLGGSAVKAAI